MLSRSKHSLAPVRLVEAPVPGAAAVPLKRARARAWGRSAAAAKKEVEGLRALDAVDQDLEVLEAQRFELAKLTASEG